MTMMIYSRLSTTNNHCKSVSPNYVQHQRPSCHFLQIVKIVILAWMALLIEDSTFYVNGQQWVCNDLNGDGISACVWSGGSPLTISSDTIAVTFGSESYLIAFCSGSIFSVSSCSCGIVVEPLDSSNVQIDEYCNSCSFSLITSTSFLLDSWDCSNRLAGDCPVFSTSTGCSLSDSVPTDPPAAFPTDPPAAFPTDPPAFPTDPPAFPADPPASPTDPPALPTDPPAFPNDPPITPVDSPVEVPVGVMEGGTDAPVLSPMSVVPDVAKSPVVAPTTKTPPAGASPNVAVMQSNGIQKTTGMAGVGMLIVALVVPAIHL
jgi:hypothetical protein